MGVPINHYLEVLEHPKHHNTVFVFISVKKKKKIEISVVSFHYIYHVFLPTITKGC